jgi:putative heme-binding domain-containing protein
MRQKSFLLAIVLTSQCAQAQIASPQGVAEGKKLFATLCSVGYCHGAEGRAGRGPRLRDREWDRNYLLKVIDAGIPDSSMPAWRGKLTTEQLTSIVAYILSISKEVTPAGASTPGRQPDATGSAGRAIANVAAGKALFFDATNDRNCGVCHKFEGAGGDIGTDLGKIASQPARDILQRILVSRESSSRRLVEIVTKDGETLRGVLAEENASGLRVYDLTSPGPPVARTISLVDIAQRRSLDTNTAHDSFAATYTIKQLLDILTYLKSSHVKLEDVF